MNIENINNLKSYIAEILAAKEVIKTALNNKGIPVTDDISTWANTINNS